jgi:hypothetical protein
MTQNVVSKKHFGDHDVQTPFTNQKDLAQKLKDMGKVGIIETDELNPLTIRLFNIKEALDEIKTFVSELLSQELPECFRPNYTGSIPQSNLFSTPSTSGSPGYLPHWNTSLTNWDKNPLLLSSSPSFDIDVNIEDKVVRIMSKHPIYAFYLHRGLYNFFSNLDSSLDCVRLELNSIYFDGRRVLDDTTLGNQYWEQYSKPNNPKVERLEREGFTDIKAILTGSLSMLYQKTNKYRNRLIHDGILDIFVNLQDGKVFLPDDPLVCPPVFGTELALHVESVFLDLQKLFRDIYAQIILDIDSKGSIPLIV